MHDTMQDRSSCTAILDASTCCSCICQLAPRTKAAALLQPCTKALHRCDSMCAACPGARCLTALAIGCMPMCGLGVSQTPAGTSRSWASYGPGETAVALALS